MNFKAALPILLAAALASGCGDTTDSSLRVVNASGVAAKLEVRRGDDVDFRGLSAGDVTDYEGVQSGSHTYKVLSDGGATTLAETTATLTKDTAYTLVAYGPEGSLKVAMITDNVSTPNSGYAKVRVMNASRDAGPVDVFIGGEGDTIEAAPITFESAGYGQFSSYVTLTSGTRRLRVTATSDRSDLKLDLRGVEITDGGVLTIVLTPTQGGVLVDAINVRQKTSVITLRNDSARMRVAAGLSEGGTVNASVGGTSLASGLRAPALGNYQLIRSGSRSMEVSVNGALVQSGTYDIQSGGEYTLLVSGAPDAPSTQVLVDDNRLPSASTKTRMRLVNGTTGLAGGLALSVDYATIVSGVTSPSASRYATLSPIAEGRIEVTADGRMAPVYLTTDATLQSDAVYSLFVMSDGASPTTVLRRDR